MALLEFTLLAATVGLLLTPFPLLALAPGVATVAGIWMTRYPAVALYAIVALIPFGALRKVEGLNLPWMFAAFLLALLFVQVAIRRTVPVQWATSLWLLLFAYLGVNALSTGLSAYPDRAKHELFMIVSAYIFILLVMTFVSEVGFRRTLHRVIVWSASVGSLLSIGSYATGITAFTETNAQTRFMGGAIDPNNQSIMILFVAPLIAHLALFAEKRHERMVMTGLGLVNVLGLLLTQSRSGLLMGLLMALALLVHYRKHLQPKRLGALIAGGALATILLLAALPASFYQRQESLAEWQDTSLIRRTSYLVVAWRAFQQHPIIGSGPGSFAAIYAQSDVTRLFTSKEDRRARRAHNTYLEILIGSGVLGLSLFLVILLYSWHSLRRAEEMFSARGDDATADLVGCYRIGFAVLLLFLLMMSDMQHKYMLLSLGLSQVAVYLAHRPSREPAWI